MLGFFKKGALGGEAYCLVKICWLSSLDWCMGSLEGLSFLLLALPDDIEVDLWNGSCVFLAFCGGVCFIVSLYEWEMEVLKMYLSVEYQIIVRRLSCGCCFIV